MRLVRVKKIVTKEKRDELSICRWACKSTDGRKKDPKRFRFPRQCMSRNESGYKSRFLSTFTRMDAAKGVQTPLRCRKVLYVDGSAGRSIDEGTDPSTEFERGDI